MKRFIYLLMSLLIVIALGACKRPSSNNLKKVNLDSLESAYFEDFLKLYPVFATQIGDTRYDSIYPNDISVEFLNKAKNTFAKYSQMLDQADTTLFTPSQYLNFSLLRREVNLSLEGFRFHDEYMPIDQLNGNIWAFAQMGSGQSFQPFKTYQDYENFLKRIDGFVSWCDTAIYNMRKGVKLGYVKPACVIKKAIPQLQDLIVNKPEESIFYEPVKNFPAAFSQEQKDALTDL